MLPAILSAAVSVRFTCRKDSAMITETHLIHGHRGGSGDVVRERSLVHRDLDAVVRKADQLVAHARSLVANCSQRLSTPMKREGEREGDALISAVLAGNA